jgi:hypothetical protein
MPSNNPIAAYITEGYQMENVNVTTVSAAVQNLSACRANVVKAAGKTGEVIKAYAVAMNQAFDLVDNQGAVTSKWFELKGKLKAGVNDERKAFKAAMESAGFSNATADVYWQRVKEASGYQTTGQRVQGASSVDEKTMAELKTIINRIFKAEENGDSTADKSSEVKGQLMDIFAELGGDIDTLG